MRNGPVETEYRKREVSNITTPPTLAQTRNGCCDHALPPDTETSWWLEFVEPAVCLIALLVGLALEPWGVDSDSLASLPTNWPAVAAYVFAFVGGGGRTTWEALRDLVRGEVNIDLLMVLAAVGAAAMGDWPEGAVLLFLFSLSHALEHFILGKTRRAIASLMKLTPEVALVVREGVEQTIPVDQLVVADRVIILPSERIPADGIVREGHTVVDQSPMTGESVPVEKQPGDPVLAGTLNKHGAIRIDVTRAAGETTLARMVRLVETAQSERAESQQFTDWFGQRYTWIVLAGTAAILAMGMGLLDEPFARSFKRAMTALVVASPCAVVISIPAAILTAIAGAARSGVLFKGGSHLERTAKLVGMAFDKTGTLTIGKPALTSLFTAPGVDESTLLTLAAALEEQSEHPLALAIVEAAHSRGLSIPQAEEVSAVVGHGIVGSVDGERVRAGKLSWFLDSKTECDATLAARAIELQSAGQTLIGVADEERVIGILAVSDPVRPSAAEAIRELRRLGLTSLTMLSGDHPSVVARIAEPLGLTGEGGLLPEDKLKRLDVLKQFGPIGMIGDGMNDAPSLAAASVGFSLGGAGTDVALETADVVLMADDLMKLPYAIALARETQRVIKQNLVIAFTTMAVLLLTTFVIVLPLPLAVLGHEGSTVVVILNGLRLLWFRSDSHAK